MLKLVVCFLLIFGIIFLGITIIERIKARRKKDEIWKADLEQREEEQKSEAAYVAEEALKFAEKHPYSDPEIPTKKTLHSPQITVPKKTFGTRAVPGQMLKVSDRKLVRDHYAVSDTYCEDDCVPLITPVDILAAAVIVEAVTHTPDYFDGGAMVSSYDNRGGLFDGGGASDTYEEPKQTYTAPDPDPEPESPSYSEPDSSSSWSSDDDT